MSADEEELDRMEAKILASMADPEIAARIPDWETPADLARIGFGGARSAAGGLHFDGGTRWAVVSRLDPKPQIVPMDNEATARQFHKSWGDFAKSTAAPNEPDRWPVLVTTQITWSEVR